MSLFFRRENRNSDPVMDLKSPSWNNLGSRMTKSGVNVSEESSIQYLTILACVSLLAGDMASLPLVLYRETASGRDRASDHPSYLLAHDKPNPEMSAFSYREMGQGHCCLWGNHYSLIERNKYTGSVMALWPISKPGSMEIKRDEKNRLVYAWTDENGNKQTRFQQDIFHVPGFSFDGVKGISNIAAAREAIGLGRAMEEFGALFFGQGMNMAGVVTLDRPLGDQEDEYVEALKKNVSGLKNSHGIMLLQNGEKYTAMGMPMQDAQFIESRKFQKIEIAGLYHIPPHKIGIYEKNTNRSNTEQENQNYIDCALMHWIRRWEFAFNLQVLTQKERNAGYYYEFLLDALLRGDSAARADYYFKRWQMGSISADEIRKKENENKIAEGGDVYFVPANYIPMKDAGKVGVNGTGKTNVQNDGIPINTK